MDGWVFEKQQHYHVACGKAQVRMLQARMLKGWNLVISVGTFVLCK